MHPDLMIQDSKKITVFCHECKEESFIVVIDDGGVAFDGETTFHWAAGDGKCENCGIEGYWMDSSH